jgi:hypothetical protein
MFMRRSAQVIDLPRPEGRVPATLAQALVTYDQLAKDLGFAPEDLVRARLMTYFSEKGIRVYDYAEVDMYLRDKCVKDKQDRWVWRPLRQKDVPAAFWNGDPKYNHGCYWTHSCPPYSRIVPRHALEKVALIERAFKDQVQFFVSDYPVKAPDPFIGVRVINSHDPVADAMIIFDVWDEPGFGA